MAVGEPAVVENLQQHVEHVLVRLFHLVEEHHRIRFAPDGFGELAAFLITDITRRRADEPRDRVLLHVLAHIQADHVVLAVEEGFREGTRQFGFAHAGGSEENEGADGAFGVFETGTRPDDGVSHGFDGFVLANDALVQDFVEPQQFFVFAFGQAADGDARPERDHVGDFLRGDFFLE